MRVTESEFRILTGQTKKPKRPRISARCWATRPLGARRSGPEHTGPWTYVLELPLVPSKNAEPRNTHEIGRMRRHWSDLAVLAWSSARMPHFEQVKITPVFHCRRATDLDNLMGQAFKGVLDGLKGRLMPDDDPSHCQLGAPEIVIDKLDWMELRLEEQK